jgi:hypothetical protein
VKVRDLIIALSDCELDADVVIQVGHGDGYYSHHDFVVWADGHIGHNGPILMPVAQAEANEERKP